MKKVFVIGTCLTQGIREAVVLEEFPTQKIIRVHVPSTDKGPGFETTLCWSDYRETREAAVSRAEDMRLSKIKTLRNQLLKLETMKFE